MSSNRKSTLVVLFLTFFGSQLFTQETESDAPSYYLLEVVYELDNNPTLRPSYLEFLSHYEEQVLNESIKANTISFLEGITEISKDEFIDYFFIDKRIFNEEVDKMSLYQSLADRSQQFMTLLYRVMDKEMNQVELEGLLVRWNDYGSTIGYYFIPWNDFVSLNENTTKAKSLFDFNEQSQMVDLIQSNQLMPSTFTVRDEWGYQKQLISYPNRSNAEYWMNVYQTYKYIDLPDSLKHKPFYFDAEEGILDMETFKEKEIIPLSGFIETKFPKWQTNHSDYLDSFEKGKRYYDLYFDMSLEAEAIITYDEIGNEYTDLWSKGEIQVFQADTLNQEFNNPLTFEEFRSLPVDSWLLKSPPLYQEGNEAEIERTERILQDMHISNYYDGDMALELNVPFSLMGIVQRISYDDKKAKVESGALLFGYRSNEGIFVLRYSVPVSKKEVSRVMTRIENLGVVQLKIGLNDRVGRYYYAGDTYINDYFDEETNHYLLDDWFEDLKQIGGIYIRDIIHVLNALKKSELK